MLTAAASTLSNNSGSGGSYSNDRSSTATGEAEVAADPASGGFFLSDYKKHDDLKQMLDSNKDGLKLEAMKRIIGMVAKGRDASELFPSVVKNVVSKNIEVKKLVYVYLVRYAEDQQDLALLSISTFQRALKDPNQLIRASALRVLSSIRVSMIVPIVILAIKDSASDMSPYVRKTAAHAIPKLYSLDPEQKDELIGVIEKLLSDKTTLVVGSVVMAFEEVCPERIDLIHKNYRKLCSLLVDVDEWGQVVIVNMLTRYARTQFVNPNFDDSDDNIYDENEDSRNFYDSDSAVSDSADNQNSSSKKPAKLTLDADHRLLLRNTKPLLQSRNASVVMAVAQLYHHTAPRGEVIIAAKALIRLLRGHREVQSVVLHSIAGISITRKGMFTPFLKSFFVRTSDPTHIKLLKLDILTNLATESSIGVILREFQTYISSSDKEFVAASIQAIGRCATNIKEVTDTCLTGLVTLLSNRDEAIVAESVVVIKKLLQTQPNEHKDIIAHMAKLMDFITVPQARASILWLLGEYSDRVPKIAPDVLRKMAKNFVNEQDIVKLQILNLAVKLYLISRPSTKIEPFCQYVFQLAKYDKNYDIRDRARFLRPFIFTGNEKDDDDATTTNQQQKPADKKLAQFAKRIFLAPKPAPTLMPRYQSSQDFQMGTLSHYLDMNCSGYRPLPPFPEMAPDATVRDVAEPVGVTIAEEPEDRIIVGKVKQRDKRSQLKERSFYSDEEQQSSPADESESEEESGGSSSDSSGESSDSSDSEFERYSRNKPRKAVKNESTSGTASSSSEEEEENDDESESNSGSDSEIDSDESAPPPVKTAAKKQTKGESGNAKGKSNLDLLLDLDDVVPMTPVLTPSLGGFLATPVETNNGQYKQVATTFVPIKKYQLVNKISGKGLTVDYRFTRSQHLVSPVMVSVELSFDNGGNDPITNIHIGSKNLTSGMVLHEFAPIARLEATANVATTLGINFNDSTQPANFTINFTLREEQCSCHVNLKAPIGEIVSSVTMPSGAFDVEKSKLKGMNEHIAKFTLKADARTIVQKVVENANLAVVSNVNNEIKFAAQTLASKSLVLVMIKSLQDDQVELCVNCEKMVIGSILLNELKSNLK